MSEEAEKSLLDQVTEERDKLKAALREIAEDWAQPARSIAQEVLAELQKEENLTGGEIMKGEKNTQKSGEGYPNTKIMGPKGGNPTNKGGINRPTKGEG